MSTPALFIPHAALALSGDPLESASMGGSLVSGDAVRDAAAAASKAMLGGAVVDPASRLGAWASYVSVPGALPAEWNDDAKLAGRELRELDELTQRQGKASDDGDTEQEGGPEGWPLPRTR